MKKMLVSLLVNLIGGIIGVGLVLGFFWVLGVVEQFIESHIIILPFLGIATLIIILKNI